MSSFTYPNVLVKEYLKRSRRLTPEIEMTADSYINQGYQTLLNYEIRDTGGFDWHGNPPANLILSAYGLLEFTDMAKVFDVDERVIERAQSFVLSKQKASGSWDLEGSSTAWSWRGLSGEIVVTAYVTWGLAESGYKGEPLERAIQWLATNALTAQDLDLYTLSLLANAFAAWDGKDDRTFAVLEKLDKARIDDTLDGTAVSYWSNGSAQTLYYAKGASADVEATSLAAYALAHHGGFATSVTRALSYLVKTKQGNGTWGSTQATILAFKALLYASQAAEGGEAVEISLSMGDRAEKIRIDPDQADVMQLVDLGDATRIGENRLSIEVSGETNLMYQVVSRYYLPWADVPEEKKPIAIELAYDRTKLAVSDTLACDVKVRYQGDSPTFMVIVTLGLPPGFVVDAGDFAELLGEKKIDRYELTPREVRIYLGAMEPGQEFAFRYHLSARYPLKAKTAKSEVYEYYTPENKDVADPVEIEVTER
ncbi:MAG: hypothetical protein HY720_11735 [Planctomycetes bacterium]|nr:hypothetical protein [Planctomycetota bacterium]